MTDLNNNAMQTTNSDALTGELDNKLKALGEFGDLEKLEEMLKTTLEGMESEVQAISATTFVGKSNDRTVTITIDGTCMIKNAKDIQMGKAAFDGGIDALKLRLQQAWNDAIEQVQGFMRDKLSGFSEKMSMPDSLRRVVDGNKE